MPRRPSHSVIVRVRAAGVVVFLLACSVKCVGPLDPKPLRRFESCAEMQMFIEDRVLDSVHAGPSCASFFIPLWGCAAAEGEGEGGDYGAPGAPREATAVADEDSSGGGGRTTTQTNTQEVDVDEPDLVKNDENTIFVVAQKKMYIVDAWPPADIALSAFVDIEGEGIDMLFAPGRALVMSRIPATFDGETGSHVGHVILTLVDVADPTAPRVLRKTTIEGDLIDSRRVGDEVMVVTGSQVFVPFHEIDNRLFHDDDTRHALREAGLTGMFPRMTDDVIGDGDQAASTQAAACTDTFASDDVGNYETMSVLLVHAVSMANEEAPILSTAVIANYGEVYATPESVWLATPEQHDGGFFTPQFTTTRLHRLAAFAGETGAAEYTATGLFYGFIKDELSLSERDGLLRMVITDDGQSYDQDNQKTALLVIEEDGNDLLEVSRVDNIGKGENVEAVRFLGDRAYVVTFPQQAFVYEDPLFVIDLSKPREPVLRGELEVDGYSTYIHPLDEDHILTIGVQADRETGAVSGMNLSIFDVEDAAKPKLAHRLDLAGGTTSEALFDRHAFTFFAEQKLLSIPLSQQNTSGAVSTSAVAVFSVDVDAGIEQLGAIDMDGLVPDGELWSFGCATARRSVGFHDEDLGTFIYGVSRAGIVTAAIDMALAGDARVAQVSALVFADSEDQQGCLADGAAVDE